LRNSKVTDISLVIDRLYERVTSAIFTAEEAEARGDLVGARKAYLEVSFLEEDIASRLDASDTEGAIARRGAITAALSADLPERALDIVHRYLREELPTALDGQLKLLQAEALSKRTSSDLRQLHVRPAARFALEAVA
jgi:hypothetical protein